MARSTVEDRDVGFHKLVKELDYLANKAVTAGWQGKSALDSHIGQDATMVDIATFHEFGTVTIPSRPALSSTFDTHGHEIEEFIGRELDKMMKLEQKAERALNRIGLKAVALVQARIRSSPEWAVPLEEETIERKKSSTPLIDTGRLRQSVSYAIRDGDTIVEQHEGQT